MTKRGGQQENNGRQSTMTKRGGQQENNGRQNTRQKTND